MNLKDKTMSNDSTKPRGTVEQGFFRASAADFKKTINGGRDEA